VHFAGLIFCAAAVVCLLALAGRSGRPAVLLACAAYSATLVALFACSTLFHHGPIRSDRRRLRQVDHAAIFLTIAGTYTPFTVGLLHGIAAVAITATVWTGAVWAAAFKLMRPLPYPGFSSAGYLGVGALALVGLQPVLYAVDAASLLLIVLGLAIYASGALIRGWRRLRYRNTIWHLMVLAGAASHFFAILHGVILRPM
jgi:hemolysin III